MKTCMPFLYRQIEAINPNVLITLGATATEGILGPGVGITKRRAAMAGIQKINIGGRDIAVLPTLHPSYLLRNPPAKMDAAKDLALVKGYLK
jgi:DNA polymerase